MYYLIGTIIVLFFLVSWHTRTYGYICKSCGGKFDISKLQNFITPHFFSVKFTKCTHCGKMHWNRMFKY